MLTRDQFLDQVDSETRICKHLASKITPEDLDHSLGASMRTTLELLRYLTCCAEFPARGILEGAWGKIPAWSKERDSMAFEEFAESMDRQAGQLRELISAIPEQDFETRQVLLPWGLETTLGDALFTTSLKFLAGYRMQLFLQIKARDPRGMGTYDCWMGCSRPA